MLLQNQMQKEQLIKVADQQRNCNNKIQFSSKNADFNKNRRQEIGDLTKEIDDIRAKTIQSVVSTYPFKVRFKLFYTLKIKDK